MRFSRCVRRSTTTTTVREDAGDARERWYASILALRSRARRLGGAGGAQAAANGALEDATEASVRCPYLPAAWEARFEAAQPDPSQRALAASALTELLYLQPAGSEELSREEASRRRQQSFELARLRK